MWSECYPDRFDAPERGVGSIRALVIGRFQPFHLGHLHVIEEVAEDADELIIAIAASEDSGTETNPFTAEERGEMIGRALQEAGTGPFIIVEVPDIHDPPRWARHVESMVPAFDVVVAHNQQTLELFEDAGMPTRPATPYRIDELSGTRVRRLMASGGQWEGLVPPTVAVYLEDIDGPARLERIAEDP